MDQKRFEELVEAYGATPSRWPEAERDAAEAYLKNNPDSVKALLEEASALDDMLNSAGLDQSVPEDFQARLQGLISAERGVPEQSDSVLRFPARMPQWAAGLAAALALTAGLGLGWIGSDVSTPEPVYSDEILLASAFSALDEETSWLQEDTQ